MQLMNDTNVVNIFYFGIIGDYKNELPDEYRFNKNDTTGNLWNKIQKKIKYDGEVLVAVNHIYVDMKYTLKNGDEVAFFPPVTGG